MIDSTIALAAIIALISTVIGGLFAMRFQKHLSNILGFSGGVILGVVAFDILPEVFEASEELGIEHTLPMIALVAGYLVFHAVEKILATHHVHEEHGHEHSNPRIGRLSALALVGHSFMDGIAIGTGFHVSTEVGLAVTLAVIAHNFSDGLNTVSLMLRYGDKRQNAFIMLAAAALAPVFGVITATLIPIPQETLPMFLAFIAGSLLYISSSSILPAAHRQKFSWFTYSLTIAGATIIFFAAELAHA